MMDRRNKIDLALRSYKAENLTRTETIEFRGNLISVPVVTINPELPLLNPNNSRLRAQIENHPRREVVKTEPKSPEAQGILQNLLIQTEKFGELRQQITDYRQQEPGIISVDGLLINGNTRLAAIRTLGINGFDVAVLPQDATDEDFFSIEMSLQLRKLVHQDYTYTNRLLLVQNHLERTGNEDATINAMQWKRNGIRRLKDYLGFLQIVEEIRSLNLNLSYEFFDDKEELIKNIYTQYQSMLANFPRGAETLKWTRITALLLRLNKDEVREIDDEFLQDILIPATEGLEVSDYLERFRTNTQTDFELDDLLGEIDSDQIDPRRMAQDIASKVIGQDGSINDESIENHFKLLHDQFRIATRKIREDRVITEMRAEPVQYLKDVTQRIQDLADRIPNLFEDDGFDKRQFEYQARKTQKAIDSLHDALNRKLDVSQ